MSADNGFIVCKLYDSKQYGVFYYFDGGTYHDAWYSRENVRGKPTDSPIEAILKGHEMNRNSPTEYGVAVHSLTLTDAWQEFRSSDIPQ